MQNGAAHLPSLALGDDQNQKPGLVPLVFMLNWQSLETKITPAQLFLLATTQKQWKHWPNNR
jgi:hypothetical protein